MYSTSDVPDKYSSNELRKTLYEHLNIACQNLIAMLTGCSIALWVKMKNNYHLTMASNGLPINYLMISWKNKHKRKC